MLPPPVRMGCSAASTSESQTSHAAEDRSALGYHSFLASSAPSVVTSPDDCFVGRVLSKNAFVVLPARKSL